MTHSLLASWLYTMKENPYEDLTTERDPMGEFMLTLRREPTPTTEAMQNGIDFENLVTAILAGRADPNAQWYDAAEKVARRCSGGVLQYRAKKPIEVGGMNLLLYGRLDCLKAGNIIDIKFTKSYDVGKYFSSTQHPTYFELIPEARQFTYLASNGSAVWPETYRREDTPSIFPVISDFLDWLRAVDLLEVYKEKWKAQRPTSECSMSASAARLLKSSKESGKEIAMEDNRKTPSELVADLMLDPGFVLVPQDRYEELIRAETERDVLEETIMGNNSYNTDKVLEAIQQARSTLRRMKMLVEKAADKPEATTDAE